MSRTICLYLHVHQPYRIKHYTAIDMGVDHDYFSETDYHADANNERILRKVAEKSYIPTNERLLALLKKHSRFKISLSITGTVLEQLETWAPEALESFRQLVATGKVEILAETYHHSLAFFYSYAEFEKQVRMHTEKIKEIFGVTPKVFRNTELMYNNDVAHWADKAGYAGIIAEGWDKVLGWRSPNFVYRPAYTNNIRLLLKNYKLSDDIAFRFSNRQWKEWPLTAAKYAHWIDALPAEDELVNLFMDYETFGEHQWKETGIFDFLTHFPEEFLKDASHNFMTISEAIDTYDARDTIDVAETITWADEERDMTAWLGNTMQQQAIAMLYSWESDVLASGDLTLIEHWRKLQASDHFYYMCTKWFHDGDVHAYFSPYESPYEAFIAFMNAARDIKLQVEQRRRHHG